MSFHPTSLSVRPCVFVAFAWSRLLKVKGEYRSYISEAIIISLVVDLFRVFRVRGICCSAWDLVGAFEVSPTELTIIILNIFHITFTREIFSDLSVSFYLLLVVFTHF